MGRPRFNRLVIALIHHCRKTLPGQNVIPDADPMQSGIFSALSKERQTFL